MNASQRVVSGEQFKRWREAQGLTVGLVANRLGIARGTAQRLDRTGLTLTQALALTASLAGMKPLSFAL